MQPGRDPLGLGDADDGLVGQLGQPAADGDGVLGRQSSSTANEWQVDFDPASVHAFEAPILLPFRAWQRPRPAIDLAHRFDIPARIAEKKLPLFGMLAGRGAFDAEQLD
jgi:hypothetical protein